jgi:serine/threonine protein kinase
MNAWPEEANPLYLDLFQVIESNPAQEVRLAALQKLDDLLVPPAPIPRELQTKLEALYLRERDIPVATLLLRLKNRLRLVDKNLTPPESRNFLLKADVPALEQALLELRKVYDSYKAPGATFDDRYQVEGLLAEGGMAKVFKAWRKEDRQQVAIKFLSNEFLSSEDIRRRFEREYNVLSSLHHPNIVEVYDHGASYKECYIVMEYVEGGDLYAWVRRNPVNVPLLLSILHDVCLGLSEVHSHGIVHRDVKPGNILLQPTGKGLQPKLTDFGLAKDPKRDGLTKTSTTMGTVEFLPPEQLSSPRDVTTASDVYSLGGVAYFALSGGQMPAGDYPRLEQLNPDVPAAVHDVVERCLARRPEDRWANAEEVAAALKRAAEPVGSPSAK